MNEMEEIGSVEQDESRNLTSDGAGEEIVKRNQVNLNVDVGMGSDCENVGFNEDDKRGFVTEGKDQNGGVVKESGGGSGEKDRVVVVGLLCKNFDMKTIFGKASKPGNWGRILKVNYKRRKLSVGEVPVEVADIGEKDQNDVGEASNGIMGGENDINSEQVLKKIEVVIAGDNGIGVKVRHVSNFPAATRGGAILV